MVNAAASAVCCTSTGSTVGAACGAQAPTSNINSTAVINAFRFMCKRDSLLSFGLYCKAFLYKDLGITGRCTHDHSVSIKSDKEAIIFVQDEIPNHLSAAHPGYIQIIAGRCVYLLSPFNGIFEDGWATLPGGYLK